VRVQVIPAQIVQVRTWRKFAELLGKTDMDILEITGIFFL
jgi:hypothetical protein